MTIVLIALGVGSAGALFAWAAIRLFTGGIYRAGPENGWAQRNDIRRESRGPDSYIGHTSGIDATGGAAE
jgi:hypothetical protein